LANKPRKMYGEDSLRVTQTPLKDLLVVELDVHGDERGFFVERFHEKKFSELGLPTHFPQDNHSRSTINVLRGLHCQYDEPQGKLVGVIRGKIWDVAVDIREKSDTFGQYFGIELDDISGKLLWVPPGFAHGFCVLSEGLTDVFYKTTSIYNPNSEIGIAWDDSDLCINWPVQNPVVSERDKKNISFADYKSAPKF
jgi:dTDP-4-dehydrorhamnose 3,5-epimerase